MRCFFAYLSLGSRKVLELVVVFGWDCSSVIRDNLDRNRVVLNRSSFPNLA
ncbi:hypothetical protein PTT_09751 [Pyrenophora teres f. teres 0-1]|uniref:Uncharacterized protein n=1 Tax=Pyrenophora teres f. teres (strain 0-1) TaxID=861557 RepID=E3RMQ4_PYRTT|nr:hypothetical protein PTT_09751 [Pyrenophora teres f. teres 0-1]